MAPSRALDADPSLQSRRDEKAPRSALVGMTHPLQIKSRYPQCVTPVHEQIKNDQILYW